MQGGCREAVLGWLWTLAGANEPRSAGGEKGVLRDEATLPGAPPPAPACGRHPAPRLCCLHTRSLCGACALCVAP